MLTVPTSWSIRFVPAEGGPERRVTVDARGGARPADAGCGAGDKDISAVHVFLLFRFLSHDLCLRSALPHRIVPDACLAERFLYKYYIPNALSFSARAL